MNTCDPTTLVSGPDAAIGAYQVAAQAYLRAVCSDTSLTVLFGSENLPDDSVVVVPAPESINNRQQLARHRGLLDSYAFMKQFHNPDVHRLISPADETSERLFNLMERERFEALGSALYAGAGQNLAKLWADSYPLEMTERFGGVEQLEWVVSFLCRECLGLTPAPQAISQKIAPVLGPVETLVGEHLQKMAACCDDQQRYARQALRLLDSLGLSSEPAQHDGDGASLHNEPISTSVDSDVEQDDKNSGASDVVDDGDGVEEDACDATEDAHEVLVRNAEHENDSEEELSVSDMQLMSEREDSTQSSDTANSASADDYLVYDSGADEEVSALDLVNPVELKSLKRALDQCVEQHVHLIQRLASRFHRHLMARQRRGWLDEQDEGELDTNKLTRLITDPATPVSYRVETQAPVRSTTVTILVDNSRSMLGKPIELAAVCTELLTRTLERCGVSSEVLGFTTVSMYGGATKAHWQQTGEAVNPGRLNNIRHIVYKSAHTPWRRAKERFAVMLKSDVLKQNIDGEALLWAHKRLLKREEDKRLLIVVSDGAPSDAATLSANNKDLLLRHLRSVINRIESQSPVHLLAIGIGHDVSEHYANAIMINDAEELGPALLDQLSRLLLDSDSRLVA